MEPIRPTQTAALFDLLRKMARGVDKKGSVVSSGIRSSHSLSGSMPSLAQKLSELVAHIDSGNDTELAGVRIPLLQCILRHEWGSEAADDPAFPQVIENINQTMASEPRLNDVLRNAVRAIQARE